MKNWFIRMIHSSTYYTVLVQVSQNRKKNNLGASTKSTAGMDVAARGSKLLGDAKALVLALNDITIRGGRRKAQAVDGAHASGDSLAVIGFWNLIELIGWVGAQVAAVASASAHGLAAVGS